MSCFAVLVDEGAFLVLISGIIVADLDQLCLYVSDSDFKTAIWSVTYLYLDLAQT